MTQESKIKLLTFVGYLLVAILAAMGIMLLYGELKKNLSLVENDKNTKEIISVSNVLSTLYEAESSNHLLFSEINTANSVNRDSLIAVIKEDIAILRQDSDDPSDISKLDSVTMLINLKAENENKMSALMDSILKLPANRRQLTTVLSQKDLDDIESVIRSRDMKVMDSTTVLVRQKSFIQKVADIFNRSSRDSVLMNSSQKREMLDSLMPITFTRDTIAQYVTDLVYERNLKHSAYTSKLAYRQFIMMNTNKILLAKINSILSNLENKEIAERTNRELSKQEALAKSVKIVLQIAIALTLVSFIFIVLIITLLNRQVKNRKELEISKAKTESLLVNREQLMLAISHDIKAPLSSIIGFIELLSKSKLPEKDKYYLQNMQISSEQILELVSNLLDYHKLDSGKYVIHSINFSPYILINDIYQSFFPLAKTKSLELKLFNEINSLSIYNSDPFRIKQIINNLLSNALKFTNEGEINIYAKLEKHENEQWLIVTVKDTGVGISKDDLQRLFQQYERASYAETRNIEGFGLGLAISQKLANNLGGNITVESETGVGSAFTLRLPIVLVTSDKSHMDNEVNQKTSDPTLKLLFVDDDKVLLNVYFEMLKQLGYEPVLCDNSLNALETLQNTSFDLMFCDIQMPDMNGFELVERIKNVKLPHIQKMPVVALSARSDVSMATYNEAGFTTFLPKPFTSQQLLSVITSLTASKSINTNDFNSKDSIGFRSLIDFAEDDKEAAKLILNTFVNENTDALSKMRSAAHTNKWDIVKYQAHKLLPRMRMINDSEIVSILYDIENGAKDANRLDDAIKLIELRNLEALDYIEKELK